MVMGGEIEFGEFENFVGEIVGGFYVVDGIIDYEVLCVVVGGNDVE